MPVILATAATSSAGSSLYIVFMVLLVGMMVWTFYQNSQNQKKRQRMQNEIKRGDRVVTVGGIVGRVAAVTDKSIMLEVANGVEVEVVKAGVSNRIGD
jgi:preprotein translocase subunit YajC